MSSKLQIMTEGGKRLGHIKSQVPALVKAGVTPLEIEKFIDDSIKAGGDRASFRTVDNYKFATCINVNAGIVHGIPTSKPFEPGDVVKVDMGLYHDGFHLDTSLTVQIVPVSDKVTKFLQVTQKSLASAISVATAGNTVYDLGLAMQTGVEEAGYSVIRDLTGHGIGRKLHMTPFIPCFADNRNKKFVLSIDQTIAIEIMTSMGGYHLVEDPDGWTLSTQDGSITGMYEETVYISADGPIILTVPN